MEQTGTDDRDASWQKRVAREIDRALAEGRAPDPEALAGGDRRKTAEIETLIEVRSALREEEGLDDDAPDTVTAIATDPLVEAERRLSEALESGTAADLSRLEADHPGLAVEFGELRRFYAFMSDALTGEAAVLDAGKRLPERRLGKFRLERSLTIHPLGRLDDAVEERTGAKRVLHLFNPSLPKTVALRLLRDAVSVRRLADPGFVPIAEVSEAENVRFLAYEHVDGETLEALLAREKGAPGPPADGARVRRAARLAGAVAGALHRAHAQGVLHLDLRPSNVVLAADGRILLRGANLMPALRSAWRVVGAGRTYLAPETLASAGPNVDWRADVYGCSALLYALLVGEAPPPEAAARQVALAAAPPVLTALVQRGLDADPKARPTSCETIAKEVAPFAGGAVGSRRLWAVVGAVAVLAAAAYAVVRVFGS